MPTGWTPATASSTLEEWTRTFSRCQQCSCYRTKNTFCRTRSLSNATFFYFLFTSWKSDDFSLRYGDMAIYRFSKWRPSAILELFWHHTRPLTKSLLLTAAACQISCQSDTQIWRYSCLNFSHILILIVVRARVRVSRQRRARRSRLASQGPRLAAGHAAKPRVRGEAASCRGKAAYNLVWLEMPIQVPKIGVLGDFGPLTVIIHHRDPQKAHPCVNLRLLSYQL